MAFNYIIFLLFIEMFSKQNAHNTLFLKLNKGQGLFSKNYNHSSFTPVSVVGNFLNNVRHNDLEKATRHKQDSRNPTRFH